MITADTITDEQIRELRGRADASGDIRLVYLCCDALQVPVDGRARVGDEVAKECRARCAEILNARKVQP